MDASTKRVITTTHILTLAIEDIVEIAKKKGITFKRTEDVAWTVSIMEELPNQAPRERQVHSENLNPMRSIRFTAVVKESLEDAIETGLEKALDAVKKKTGRKLR